MFIESCPLVKNVFFISFPQSKFVAESGNKSMICNITNSLEANPVLLHKCGVETWNPKCKKHWE